MYISDQLHYIKHHSDHTSRQLWMEKLCCGYMRMYIHVFVHNFIFHTWTKNSEVRETEFAKGKKC